MNTNKQKLKAEIAQKKAELAQLEQKLKVADIMPKERLLQLFNGCEIRIDLEKYPNSVFFFKEGKYFFEIKENYLWCSYYRVWKVFKKEYSMRYDDIQSLIQSAMEKYFKIKGIIPYNYPYDFSTLVEEYFKMMEVTPYRTGNYLPWLVEDHFKMKGFILRETM